jgi:hypothetical protein
MKIDILYPMKGRRRFSEASFAALLANTDWSLVNCFYVYDDGSSKAEGNRKWMTKAIGGCPASHKFRSTSLGSPVAVMNDYLDGTDADCFAKIDNDIIVPPDWLEALSSVMEAEPELELLGTEAGMAGYPPDGWDGSYGFEQCSHIGGVGLMRVSAFQHAERGRPRPNGRFGFTEWQHEHEPMRGWIKPDLRLFALDQLPFDPWFTLAKDYVALGIAREWGKYDRLMSWYWSWFTDA